jgi:hypothetical protein
MRTQVITGISLAFVGLIWIGQGLGLLRGSSFMVDEPFWAVAGLLFVVAGAGLVILAWSSRQSPPP